VFCCIPCKQDSLFLLTQKLLHMIIYETKQVYTKVGNIDATNLDCPQKVYDYMYGAFDSNPLQEQVFVILLNRKNVPISREQVTIGTTSSCLLDPSTVFRPAILAGASAIILSHNHPSGDPTPSSADMRITKKIKEAGKVLDIDVLDHVIIGEDSCYSFSDKGLI